MKKMECAEKLLSLVEEGTSPFHVAGSVERQLLKAGFQKLEMRKDWNLENGGRYYLVHNGSSPVSYTHLNVMIGIQPFFDNRKNIFAVDGKASMLFCHCDSLLHMKRLSGRSACRGSLSLILSHILIHSR